MKQLADDAKNDFVPFNVLQGLAACKRQSLVIKWLEDNDVPHFVARNGLPRVHRLTLAAKMGAPINILESPELESPDNEPDLSNIQ